MMRKLVSVGAAMSPERMPPKAAHWRDTFRAPLTPKNGRYYVAMLAGGPQDIYRDIRAHLAQVKNTHLRYHLPYFANRQWQRPIPEDVDYVFLLKDMCSHSDQDVIISRAKTAGVPLVRSQRKKSAYMQALLKQAGVQSGMVDHAVVDVAVPADDHWYDEEPEPAPVVVEQAPARVIPINPSIPLNPPVMLTAEDDLHVADIPDDVGLTARDRLYVYLCRAQEEMRTAGVKSALITADGDLVVQ